MVIANIKMTEATTTPFSPLPNPSMISSSAMPRAIAMEAASTKAIANAQFTFGDPKK